MKESSWVKDFKKNGSLYLMATPVILFYLLFHYKPMYGALIAFQNYSPRLGMSGSEWVGFKHFIDLFQSSDFPRLLRNTLTISITSLLAGFPFPIIFALFLNEIRCSAFKRTVQTLSYLPHFISTVVLCGMIKTFVASNGIIWKVVSAFTSTNGTLLNDPDMFLPIYVISGIWQGLGWGSILYLSALAGIDMEQYEAAEIDGAGRFRKMWSITLPSLAPTMTVVFILGVGGIMALGYEKIILLYNPAIYSKSDVISSYVYRIGFETHDWSFSAAVGLFNSACNLIFLTLANYFSKKINDTGLW